MSSQSNGNSALNFANSANGVSASGTNDAMGPNSFNFSTGLGNPDANTGLDNLNAGLTGANAGTLPNGYLNGAGGNYTPDPSLSGISAGAQNGNVSFGMPGSSMAQLAAQSLNGSSTPNTQNQNNALMALGNKIEGSATKAAPQRSGGSGKVSMKPVQFSAPVTDFAGSTGGSQAGNSLLQLLSKYTPGGA